jgi:iron-sulfur cluster assembly protein
MIQLTETALSQIRSAALQGRAVGMALRVAARRADDGSLEYGMGFDETADDDEPLEHEGLTVVVGPDSRALLAGTTLDYVEIEPGDFRFIFIPPSAQPELPPGTACGNGGCPSCSSGCA